MVKENEKGHKEKKSSMGYQGKRIEIVS